MLFYVTSSPSKIRSAKRYLSRHGIDVEQAYLDMVEIQDIDAIDAGHPLWDEFAQWYKKR